MSGEKQGDNPVVAASFLNPNEVHIFRGLLESEGIKSFIYHERANTFMPITTGGVQVAVRERDLDKARSLLEKYGGADY